MSEQRRLAAILVADVVGYSKLVGSDEPGTLARLRALRADVIEPAIGRHAGRLFKAVGDGFLVEFASAVQAVEAAQAIQQANAAGPLALRIGLHVGDVVVQGDDLMGDGINVAARIEALADAGGIALSRQVHDQVRDRLAVAFEDRGEIGLKNIARPVHVFVIAGAKAPLQHLALTLPDKPSIAVLAFQNMSNDPEQEYFADGVAEDIITELSRYRDLFVIARNSSFTYKGKAVDVRQVASELGVRYVLEGSVRKATGNRVRVTGQLIDAATGAHLWAERYDRELSDIFAVQEEITRSIVTNLAPAIEEAAIAGIRRTLPANLTAHEIATRAWAESNAAYLSDDQALRQRALASAQRALELDGRCVRAWLAVAWIQWQSAFYANAPPQAFHPGMDAARRAIELDRLEHRAYMIRGLLHLQLEQYDDALADLRQACALNPNDASALGALGYGEVLYGDGPAAKAHLLESLRLSPRDPWRYNTCVVLGNACSLTGHYAEGLKWTAEARREHPNFPPALSIGAKLHVALGQIDQARRDAELLRRLRPLAEERVKAGRSLFRRAEDGEREISLMRVAFGLSEAPRAGQAPPIEPVALTLPDKPSIAVLPFQNMSGDPEQEYFADGIVEDIITALSRDRGLFVIARNSSFTYKGHAVDIRKVGRELAVRYVLEGSVRRAGNKVRITSQLIEAETGSHVWADRFDGGLEDIFELQDRIANKVASMISPAVEMAEIDRAIRKIGNLQAYDLYLRAKAAWAGLTSQALDEALGLAQMSVALDPSFARCHALVAQIHIQRVIGALSVDSAADAAAAERAAQRALALDGNDATILAAYGSVVAFSGGRHGEALPLLDKAIDLDPNLAIAWTFRGMCKRALGWEDEAIRDIEHALRLNPRDPRGWVAEHALAWGHLMAGRYEQAASGATTVMQMSPGFGPSLRVAIAAHAFAGRLEKARELLATYAAIEPGARISTLRENYLRRTTPEGFEKLADGLRKAGFPE